MNVLDLLGSDSKYYGINGVILYKIMCSLSVVKYLSYIGCFRVQIWVTLCSDKRYKTYCMTMLRVVVVTSFQVL